MGRRRRGRPSLGDAARHEIVSVRFTPFEYATMEGWADDAGQTLSEWIRSCCKRTIGALDEQVRDLCAFDRTGNSGEWFWNYHHIAKRWVFNRIDDASRQPPTRLLLRVRNVHGKRYEFTTETSIGCGPSADAVVRDNGRGFVELVTSLASVASWPELNDLHHAAIEAWEAKVSVSSNRGADA